MDDKTHQLLTQLAEKLGVTVEYLWTVLVRQAQVEFYSDLIYHVFAVVFMLLTIRYMPRWLDAVGNAPYNEEGKWVVKIASLALATVVFTLTSFFSITDTITKVSNPEYWAFKQLTRLVK